MAKKVYLLLTEESLFARFQALAKNWQLTRLTDAAEIAHLPAGSLIVVDTATRDLPALSDARWRVWCGHQTIAFASSAPDDEEGLALLDMGASGYCQIYASIESWQQILSVLDSGELWVGRRLMSRLLRNIRPAKTVADRSWQATLTDREREVALRAAQGEANQAIAQALGITERTVKAHMTTILAKLEVSDRLQLALRVHGIQSSTVP